VSSSSLPTESRVCSFVMYPAGAVWPLQMGLFLVCCRRSDQERSSSGFDDIAGEGSSHNDSCLHSSSSVGTLLACHLWCSVRRSSFKTTRGEAIWELTQTSSACWGQDGRVPELDWFFRKVHGSLHPRLVGSFTEERDGCRELTSKRGDDCSDA